jgi:hypothetical protein
MVVLFLRFSTPNRMMVNRMAPTSPAHTGEKTQLSTTGTMPGMVDGRGKRKVGVERVEEEYWPVAGGLHWSGVL